MNSDVGQIMQFGYVVENIEQTANDWSERLGVGPFYGLDRIDFDQFYYRGKHTELSLQLAFSYWGDIQIELIRPLNTADTLYSRAVKNTPGALNHVATIVDNVDGVIAKHELHDHVAHCGHMPSGVNFVYLEEYMPGGLHLELVEAHEATQQAYSAMQGIANGWNGERLFRSMSSLAEDMA